MKDIYICKESFSKYSYVESKMIVKGDVAEPRLTIFIPTYKRSETLRETIQSALNQKTNIPYEIIVINNDPEDLTNNVIRKLIDNFSSNKIYYCVNTENIGSCGNWNRGIELARSEYVSMIHDDDVLSPYFVNAVLEAIKEYKNPGVIGVDYVVFNSNNRPHFQCPPKIMNYSQKSKRGFFFGCSISIAGMTVRKDLILSIGGYSEEYSPAFDTVFIYQALLKDRVVNICFPLAGYRKEMNSSLNSDVMRDVIIVMELTRHNIAEHELFAKIWMRLFDQEFLYDYIRGANKYWNLDIDYRVIFERVGIKDNNINWLKLNLMMVIIRILRKGLVE